MSGKNNILIYIIETGRKVNNLKSIKTVHTYYYYYIKTYFYSFKNYVKYSMVSNFSLSYYIITTLSIYM